ncbi:rhodanese-like domain-containing protein [Cupriavidus lacunae]|uniref:rhodanese-like domain-containing protein n=1 Tax=Cupriavidus lacunae TaxID=2666307 RepID=UPI001FCA0AEB|nr:rhodanese-like domain-containing protein [Cupriavidus lacunae]
MRAGFASRPVVVYCVRGHQVSRDCATRLEKAGHSVTYLEGGIEQWVADRHPTASKPSRSE